MYEPRPDVPSPASQEADWNKLMNDYEWRINIVFDVSDPALRQSLDVVTALRKQYGRENVIVNAAIMDPDTERLIESPGRLGVHVRKDAL